MAPTIKDVAKYAGVGIGTVSRVINNEKAVGEKTRSKVLGAMQELNYSPNKMASQLRKNKTKIIALLVPIINHPFFAKLAYYIEDEADKFGYTVLLVSSQQRVEKEREIISRIKRREVDGAVFVTHFAHDEEEFKDCPIVSIDRTFGENVPYVTSNNYEATKKAVEFLLEKGAKKVGYLGSKPLVESEVSFREKAYIDVMTEKGLPVRLLNEVILHGDEGTLVNDFMEKYNDVDAVFVSGYSLSQILYNRAKDRGKEIPKDLQIVSYDGIFSQWSTAPLTSVEQPIEEMARSIVGLLVKKIRGEKAPLRTVLETRFIEGLTTRK